MPKAPDPGNVAHAIITSIGLVVKCARRMKSEGEVSLPELSALTRLERGGPTTAAALAKLQQISPPSMAATLGSLETHGLIERRPDPSDGRKSVISLSRSGEHFVRNGRTKRTERVARALREHFTPAELQQLLVAAPLLERLAHHL